jgi:hypothetical protein
MSLSKAQGVFAPCPISVHPRVPDSCSKFSVIVGTDTFKAAFKMYGVLFLVSALARKRWSPAYLLQRVLPNTMRSAAFLGS